MNKRNGQYAIESLIIVAFGIALMAAFILAANPIAEAPKERDYTYNRT